MIIFQTDYQEMYNYMIHHFLEIEIFNGAVDVGDMAKQLYPQYLYRE